MGPNVTVFKLNKIILKVSVLTTVKKIKNRCWVNGSLNNKQTFVQGDIVPLQKHSKIKLREFYFEKHLRN